VPRKHFIWNLLTNQFNCSDGKVIYIHQIRKYIICALYSTTKKNYQVGSWLWYYDYCSVLLSLLLSFVRSANKKMKHQISYKLAQQGNEKFISRWKTKIVCFNCFFVLFLLPQSNKVVIGNFSPGRRRRRWEWKIYCSIGGEQQQQQRKNVWQTSAFAKIYKQNERLQQSTNPKIASTPIASENFRPDKRSD
jgi:hypothetical protein